MKKSATRAMIRNPPEHEDSQEMSSHLVELVYVTIDEMESMMEGFFKKLGQGTIRAAIP